MRRVLEGPMLERMELQKESDNERSVAIGWLGRGRMLGNGRMVHDGRQSK